MNLFLNAFSQEVSDVCSRSGEQEEKTTIQLIK